MNDKETPTKHSEDVLTSCQVMFTELKLSNQLQLSRMEHVEKELRRLKYILITAIFALQALLPNGLGHIIDLFNKTP